MICHYKLKNPQTLWFKTSISCKLVIKYKLVFILLVFTIFMCQEFGSSVIIYFWLKVCPIHWSYRLLKADSLQAGISKLAHLHDGKVDALFIFLWTFEWGFGSSSKHSDIVIAFIKCK